MDSQCPNEQTSNEPGTRNPSFPEENAELLRQFGVFLSEAEEMIFPETENTPSVGLYQLFEVLAAQRHELKLYTKSGRQTLELLHQSMETISDAAESLRRYRKERPEVERKVVAPFLSSLIEIDESLQRAGSVLESLAERLSEMVRKRIESVAANYCDELSFWARFRQRKIVLRFVERLSRDGISEVGQTFESFRLGFDMLRDRMDDVLKKHSIRRLNPVGEPVDPETMQVLAVLDSQGIPPGHVADVIRFGYLWRDRVLRFADVRAVKEIH